MNKNVTICLNYTPMCQRGHHKTYSTRYCKKLLNKPPKNILVNKQNKYYYYRDESCIKLNEKNELTSYIMTSSTNCGHFLSLESLTPLQIIGISVRYADLSTDQCATTAVLLVIHFTISSIYI